MRRLTMSDRKQESEAWLVNDWLAVSARTLKEVWDNEEDAVYDEL